jgi:hypothetical protein
MRWLSDEIEQEMHWVETIENRLYVEVETIKGEFN